MSRYQYSRQLLDRAAKVLAGGVSSEFRKYNHPHALFYSHGKGSRVVDVDNNVYLDFTLSQGPLILGHSHPEVLHAIQSYSEQGQLYAGQHIQEIELAEKLARLIPSAELIRFCLDGSTAVQTAFRVARAKTGKQKFLRFEGHYHGWLDDVAWGISTPGVEALGSREEPEVFPWSAGMAANTRNEFIVLPWNDLDLVKQTLEKQYHEIAAIITEPVMCNNGCIEPEPGFLQGLRTLCDQYGIALIFDEVITGFRVGLGGAQSYFGVTPDLSVFAKAMGSGYPVSAVVGRREWMELIEQSVVIHAGTMNSSCPMIAAALSTIRVLERDNPYPRMFALGKRLMTGLAEAARQHNQNLLLSGPGPVFSSCFTDLEKVRDYRDTLKTDKPRLSRFIAAMHDRNIRIIGRGLWYISAVHTEEEIDEAIQVANEVLAAL
ncbi:aspartate aminotransferase family protein [Niabella drilacis]|uniref:Glutamate-1-semialdehyde 2,1-aminomutase n=1 Tax=Niabella drilacis (strain DSM 25811 / CCM 8410 / CCUG 62505 / LMG 26954 / E90) TaxID=1285928 RepID=A0A1G6S5H8_NIADE|nr:aspartate aminotransferase family protein [Niabella drilacis]SDD11397.1 glutamate-1-semialdehyde 2,1-aminomutase [Niabella drilacis]